MVLMTLIARVADALPLAASMQEDEQVKLNRVKLSSSRDTHVHAIYISGSSDLIDIFKEASGMCYSTHSNALKRCSSTTDGHHKKTYRQCQYEIFNRQI